MALDKETLLDLYRMLVKIRTFEERVGEMYYEGKLPAFDIAAGPIPGEMHLYSGQEAVAAGVCAHLRPEDPVTSTHRPHGHLIAKGVDLNAMMAEIFGKETGLCRGKGGHMHLFDAGLHFGCGGIVGGGIPHAVGAALCDQAAGPGPGRRRLLRRRRGQHRRLPRIGEPGQRVEAARRLRGRRQPLCHLCAQVGLHLGAQQRRTWRRLRNPGRPGGRPGRRGGLRGGRRSHRTGAARRGTQHRRGHLLSLPGPFRRRRRRLSRPRARRLAGRRRIRSRSSARRCRARAGSPQRTPTRSRPK